MSCDLHTHSVYSDGELEPAALVQLAREVGCHILSVTDHDCYEGSFRALEAAKGTEVTVVPGIELDVRGDVEVLIFGMPNRELLRVSLESCEMRREVARTTSEGINAKVGSRVIDYDRDIEDVAPGAILKPHMARLCHKKGLTKDFLDFKRRLNEEWFPEGIPTFDKPELSDVLRWVKDSGAVAVLAHPLYYLIQKREAEGLSRLEDLLDLQLDGFEFYYNYGPLQAKDKEVLKRLNEAILGLAETRDLLLTGGTDFHVMGQTLGSPILPESCARALCDRIGIQRPA